MFIGLKKTCLGVLDRGNRDKDNKAVLEEGGGIEMSTTVLHSRCSLLRLIYLPVWKIGPIFWIIVTDQFQKTTDTFFAFNQHDYYFTTAQKTGDSFSCY